MPADRGARDLRAVEALTFDCYGTLVDWESGILAALRAMLEPHGLRVDPSTVLRLYARFEAEAERGPYRSYRAVLRAVAERFGQHFGIAMPDARLGHLAESVADWPAFADTPVALRRLGERYRLAIVSNIDDDLFAHTLPRLGAGIEVVVTASQVRSYKPARAHFDEVLRRLGLGADRVLHCAESRFHDIGPARSLGIATCWVDRRRDAGSASASGESEARPDLSVRSMAELADRLCAG